MSYPFASSSYHASAIVNIVDLQACLILGRFCCRTGNKETANSQKQLYYFLRLIHPNTSAGQLSFESDAKFVVVRDHITRDLAYFGRDQKSKVTKIASKV